MKMTTLCYIEKDGKYLMLHRTKKEKDINKDKWIGVGGHAEEGEGPEECLLREVKEETGLFLTSYRFRGIVTFVSDQCETELKELTGYWHEKLEHFQVHTPSREFDTMINTWNAYNCFMTFIWSRAASFFYCGLRNGYG